MKVGFISLGCSKNRVDTEIMIGILKKSGYSIVDSLKKADIIIINTCGFITDAKEEAINTIIQTGILKSAGDHQYLVATGCLAQRYGNELLDEMPELDGIVGISAFIKIDSILDRIQQGERVSCIEPPPDVYIEKGPRILTTPKGSAYLKISEGCNNRCSYCAIPGIRGNLRSRPAGELVEEGSDLVSRGVRELVLIAQDTARYGWDLGGDDSLPALINGLNDISKLDWIRLMYIHPAHVDRKLIECFDNNSKLLPYVDIPVQHASNNILRTMNRKHTAEQMFEILQKMKQQINKLVLRTTVMVGFPGETDDDFKRLYDFVGQMEFDWLGSFAFVAEEGTPAYQMQDQIPEEVKLERRDLIMKLQKGITRKKNMDRIHNREKILISSRLSKNLYAGRAYFQAPEVDGMTMVKSEQNIDIGTMVDVKLEGIREYDMIGELLI